MPVKRATSNKKTTAKAPAGTKEIEVHDAISFDNDRLIPGMLGGNTFTALNKRQYYPFLDPEDNLFKTFLEVRLVSTTHSNCIEDKTFYTVGDGLKVQEQEFPTDFDTYINGEQELLDDVLAAIAESYFQAGNKFIEVVRMEAMGKRYVHVYLHR